MPRDSLPPEASSLFDQSLAGDVDAWAELLAVHRERLERYVQRALPASIRARESASDIVQQTLIEGVGSRGKFRGERPSQVAAWLFGILKHRVRDVYRKHGRAGRRDVAREVPLSLVGGSAIPASPGQASTIDHGPRGRIRLIVAGLPEESRRILLWRLDDDLPFAEIGRRLGISEDAARVRHSRLMAELRLRLQDPSAKSD